MSTTPFHVIIPARFASSRLPGKVLADIAGKSMLQHVYERSKQSGATSVTIATDDKEVERIAKSFGANVCMTRSDHTSGTTRLAEAAKNLGFKDDAIVVNVQGDEPFIPPEIISQVAEDLASHKDADVATLCVPLTEPEELFNPNNAKVVLDANGFALYFSRAPIAWERDNFASTPPKMLSGKHFRHLGIYAYRTGFIQKYSSWPTTELENLEKLEQLRVLYYGGKIHVAIALAVSPISVDHPEDLEKARKMAQH